MKIRTMWIYMRKFYKMLHKDHPTMLTIVVVGGIAKGISPFLSLFYSGRILDALLSGNRELAISQIVIMLVAVLLLGFLERGCFHLLEVLSDSGAIDVWKRMSHKAYVLEFEEFEKTETMDKIRRVKDGMNGSGGVETQILGSYQLVGHVVSILCSFVCFIQLLIKCCRDLKFAGYSLLLVLCFVGMLKIISVIQEKMAQLGVEKSHKNERANSMSNYMVNSNMDTQNGKDIRLYKMQGLMNEWYRLMAEEVINCFKGYIIVQGKASGTTAFLNQIFAALAYIFVGIGVLEGMISIGSILLYAGSITRLTGALSDAISTYNNLAYRFEYLSNFEEFINAPNMHYDGTLPVEKRDDYEFAFEFKNVSFKYPGTENYVLKNVNLKLDVNKRLAVVGQNGAGKTTLIKLLCRLYEPTEGEILLNGINIWKYDYAEYTGLFSVVFQDYKLFPLPLDENIAGDSDVDEERCLKVLEDVGLKDEVLSWPEKQHTLLYKNLGDGINVSGGEAQKIAIARALYKDAPFVIMDEPTAALDPLAEAEIYENFNSLIHEKTAIFISHRMSSCKFCDEIVVFEDGEIAQRGAHQELVQTDGLYQQLWNAQAQYYA